GIGVLLLVVAGGYCLVRLLGRVLAWWPAPRPAVRPLPPPPCEDEAPEPDPCRMAAAYQRQAPPLHEPDHAAEPFDREWAARLLETEPPRAKVRLRLVGGKKGSVRPSGDAA